MSPDTKEVFKTTKTTLNPVTSDCCELDKHQNRRMYTLYLLSMHKNEYNPFVYHDDQIVIIGRAGDNR